MSAVNFLWKNYIKYPYNNINNFLNYHNIFVALSLSIIFTILFNRNLRHYNE